MHQVESLNNYCQVHHYQHIHYKCSSSQNNLLLLWNSTEKELCLHSATPQDKAHDDDYHLYNINDY